MDLKNIEFIEKNKPAIDEDIHLLNNQIKGILPDVYKEFLKITNGAVLNEYVFYSTKDATLCGFLDAGSIGISDPDEWFDFRLWINEGCKMFEEDDNSDLGKVYIIKLPKEKLTFLAETKRIFFLNISTGLLYKKVNTLPYVIMEDIYISKADTYIEQTSFPECYEFRND